MDLKRCLRSFRNEAFYELTIKLLLRGGRTENLDHILMYFKASRVIFWFQQTRMKLVVEVWLQFVVAFIEVTDVKGKKRVGGPFG